MPKHPALNPNFNFHNTTSILLRFIQQPLSFKLHSNQSITMKILIIVFIFAVLLCPVLSENSFGQTAESQKKTTPKIFFQILLRDKDGHLYAYIQPQLQIFDMARTIAWVAQYATNSTVVFEGQSYLLMKFEDHYSGGSHFEQMGGYFLNVPINGQSTNIFYAYHDSYLKNAGDTASVYWEILVPSQ